MLSVSHIDVRYPDCDPMGIVHHAVYPIWYEIARMDFFAAVGYPYEAMNQEGINPPMVNLNLQYASPVRYPGQNLEQTVRRNLENGVPVNEATWRKIEAFLQ